MSAGADEDVRTTESGIPLERVYGEDDVAGLDLQERLGRARGVPLHPRHPPHDVPRPAVDDAPVRRLRARPRRQRALPLPAGRGRDRALDVAFDLPTQLGMDSDDPLAAGEVGRVGVAIDSVEDMARLLDGIPLDRVSTRMTINAPAAVLLLLYQLVGRGARALTRRARRHDPERRAEGVRRPRQLHLPAGALDAADHRHVRLLRRRAAAVEHDLDQRLPHPRGGLDGGAGGGLHAGQRHRLRRGGARRAGLDVDRFAPAAVVLLQRPQRPAGGGGEVPRRPRAVGPHHARPLRRHEARARWRCASTPRPAAARSPPSSRATTSCASPCRCWPPRSAARSRSTPTAFDEALALPTEESAKLALRTQQVIAAESGITDTVDPLGGQLLRGGAHGRDRGAAPAS